MSSLKELVRLEDPAFYGPDQFEVYDRLQREAPVWYYEPLDLFVISRFSDVRDIVRQPALFSSAHGLTLNQRRLALRGFESAFEAFNDPSGELIVAIDPPRHRQFRKAIAHSFTPRAIAGLNEEIARISAELVASIPSGEPIEFVEEIAAKLPLEVAVAMLGVSGGPYAQLRQWTDSLETLTNATTMDEITAAAKHFTEMKEFLRQQLRAKAEHPGPDLASILLATELEGSLLSEAHILAHLSTLLSNGGTTRLFMASVVGLLAQHPDQLGLLHRKPELLPSAIEEALRIAPPARGFIRTLTADTEIRGQQILRGQRVYLLYIAANRDPEVFADPARFDITRSSATKHLAFGFGTHACLGAPLVRVEAEVFLATLLEHFTQFELVGTPQQLLHTQLQGWREMSVRFG